MGSTRLATSPLCSPFRHTRYDQAHRLTRATVAGTTTTYTWDGDGKRATATTDGATTTFTYDTAVGLPRLLSDGTRTYVWGASGLAYTVNSTSGAVEVSHADALGSVRALTGTPPRPLRCPSASARGSAGRRRQPWPPAKWRG